MTTVELRRRRRSHVWLLLLLALVLLVATARLARRLPSAHRPSAAPSASTDAARPVAVPRFTCANTSALLGDGPPHTLGTGNEKVVVAGAWHGMPLAVKSVYVSGAALQALSQCCRRRTAHRTRQVNSSAAVRRVRDEQVRLRALRRVPGVLRGYGGCAADALR